MKKAFKALIVRALTWEAKLVLKKYKPKVVAITGSVGKTSAKDAIYTVLSADYSVRKSQKSFNSELGVPLTILGLPNGWNNPLTWFRNIIEGFLLGMFTFSYPEWLVLEVGADRPGDIESISAWLKPDVAVITRFGDVPVHVEYFPSIEDLVKEKGYLAQNLKKDGVFVYNTDDPRIRAFAGLIDRRTVTYGMNPDADVVGSHVEVMYGHLEDSELSFPLGATFRADYQGSSIPLRVHGALGMQHAYPLLAAFAVGVSQGMNPVTISQALEKHVPPRGRMNLVSGEKSTLLIDDTYNSSPVAVHEGLAALRLLASPGRKIAVLGDMLELGQYSVEEHRRVGEAAVKVADILVTVGIRSRATADAAMDNGMPESVVFQFDTSSEAGTFIEDEIMKPGDIFFVKGSQSMRMERIVEEIMAHPEKKEELLVRQEPEWQAKR